MKIDFKKTTGSYHQIISIVLCFNKSGAYYIRIPVLKLRKYNADVIIKKNNYHQAPIQTSWDWHKVDAINMEISMSQQN